MTTQVITIAADGAIQGLERKPGQGLSLRSLARNNGATPKSTRCSEIVDLGCDRWGVQPMQGPITGRPLTVQELVAVTYPVTTGVHMSYPRDDYRQNEPAPFLSYDDAVRAEIAYMDQLRLSGQLTNSAGAVSVPT